MVDSDHENWYTWSMTLRERIAKTLCYRLLNTAEALVVMGLVTHNWSVALHGSTITAVTASVSYYAFEHVWHVLSAR